MFKVSFYVDDSKLGEAFKRLTGLAANTSYAWVNNVEKTNDLKANGHAKIKAGSFQELFMQELRKRGLEDFRSDRAKEALDKIGASAASYHHFLKQAIDAGYLKKRGNTQNMIYSFTEAK